MRILYPVLYELCQRHHTVWRFKLIPNMGDIWVLSLYKLSNYQKVSFLPDIAKDQLRDFTFLQELKNDGFLRTRDFDSLESALKIDENGHNFVPILSILKMLHYMILGTYVVMGIIILFFLLSFRTLVAYTLKNHLRSHTILRQPRLNPCIIHILCLAPAAASPAWLNGVST